MATGNPIDAVLSAQPAQGNDLTATIRTQASMAGVPFDVAYRLVKQESSFNPRAHNPSGASGLTQLMPDTAKELGVTDVFNPADNLAGGFKYLAQQYKKYGNWRDALAAYDWGPGNVDSWLQRGGNIAHLPSETRNYILAIAPGSMNPQHAPNPGQEKAARLQLLGRRASPSASANPIDAALAKSTPNPVDVAVPSPSPTPTPVSQNPMDQSGYQAPGPVMGLGAPLAQTALSQVSGTLDLPFILHNAQLRDAASGRDLSILELGKDPNSYVSRALALYKKNPGQAGDEFGLNSPRQNAFMARTAASPEQKFAKFLNDHPYANAALTFIEEQGNPMAAAAGGVAGRGLELVSGLAKGTPVLRGAQGVARQVGMGSPLADIANRAGVEGSQWAKSMIASVAAPHQFLGVASTDEMEHLVFGGLTPAEKEEVVALSQGQKPDPKFVKNLSDLTRRAKLLREDIQRVTSEQERVGRLDRSQGQVYDPRTYFPMKGSYDFGPQADLEAELRGGLTPAGGGTTANRPKVFANMRASRASGQLDADFDPAANYGTWREQRLQRVAFDDSMARAPQSLRRDIAASDYRTGAGQPLAQPWARSAGQTPYDATQQLVAENQAQFPKGSPQRLDVADTPQYVRATNVLNNTPSAVIRRSMVAPELMAFLKDNTGLQKYIASGGSFYPGQSKTFAGKFIELARNTIVSNFLYHPTVNIAGNDAAARGLAGLGGPQWEAGGYAYNAARSIAQQAGVDAKAFVGGARDYATWLDRALKAGGIAEFGRPTQSALGASRDVVLTTPVTGKGMTALRQRLDKALTRFGDFNRERTFGEKGEEAFAVSLFKDAVQRGKMSDAEAGQLVRESLGDYYNYDPQSPLSAISLFMPWRKGNWKFWTSVLVRKPQYVTGTSHAIRNLNMQRSEDEMGGPFAAQDFEVKDIFPGHRPLTLPFVGRDVAQIANLAGSAAQGDPSGMLDPAMRLTLGSANPLTRASLDAYNTYQSRYSPEVQGPETNFGLIFNQKAPRAAQWGQIGRYFMGKLPVPLVGFAVQDAARRGMSPQDLTAAFVNALGGGYAGAPKLDDAGRREKARATRLFKQAYDRYMYDDHDEAALKAAWSDYEESLRGLGVIH